MVLSGWPAGGCARLRHELLRRRAAGHDWTCDVCGGEVVQRDDDTEAPSRRRLELYEQQTAPLIAWYDDRDLLDRRRRRWARPTRSPTGSIDAIDRRRDERGLMRRSQRTSWPRCARPAGSWPRCTTTIRDAIRPGVTTAELDQIGREVLERRGARRTSSATTASRR